MGHAQANGLAELVNRKILQGLNTRLDEAHGLKDFPVSYGR